MLIAIEKLEINPLVNYIQKFKVCNLALWFSIGLIYTTSPYIYAEDSKGITPEYVRDITNPYEQANNINPAWSHNGEIISYERYDETAQQIILSDKSGNFLKSVFIKNDRNSKSNGSNQYNQTPQIDTFNKTLSWSPDDEKFVFISNGGSKNFDLYLSSLNSKKSRRLTFNHAKDTDPDWSSNKNFITFVSNRNGTADLYLINTNNFEVTSLYIDQKNAISPSWSPDGKKISFMLGNSNNYQIYVIDDINSPDNSLRKLTTSHSNNMRPTWSPDGRYIAFYSRDSMSEVNSSWNIAIHDYANNSTQESTTQRTKVVIKDVIQNTDRGPTWSPDSQNIIFVKNSLRTYNPIYIGDITTGKEKKLNTNTRMNRDLSCSSQGILAFQTQDRQWNRIFIAKLPNLKS